MKRTTQSLSAEAAGQLASKKLLITCKEAAELLSTSPSKVYAMAASGELPSIKLGGNVRIPVDLLDQYLEDKKKAACGSWRGNQAAIAGIGG